MSDLPNFFSWMTQSRGVTVKGGAGSGRYPKGSGGDYKTSSMPRDEAFSELERMGDEFNLWNTENEGDTIGIAEDSDENVVAFIQYTGNTIYEVESLKKGAGTQLVKEMMDENGYLAADNVGKNASSFWEHMGFVKENHPGLAHTNYEWYKNPEEEAPQWYLDRMGSKA